MAQFEIPIGALPQKSPQPTLPPPDPVAVREQAIADNTRAEETLNGFIAAQQHALFEAPDAFFRTQGSDAIHAAPTILSTLAQLRDDSLDGLGNDAQRNRLAPSLDAHLALARDDVARHVADQSLAWQRQVAQDRIALLTKEAALHHNDDDRIAALGTAAENAARAHARIGDSPLDPQAEDAAAAVARSSVLNAAQQARAANGRDPNIVLAQASSNQQPPNPSLSPAEASRQGGSLAAAADIVTRSARPGVDNYGGRCAEAVVNALKGAGYKLPNVPFGKLMGPPLRGAGFEEVLPSTVLPAGTYEPPKSYTPRMGDVIVIDNPTSREDAGHTAIYNGHAWVSDTVQRHGVPYPQGVSTISIYRHP